MFEDHTEEEYKTFKKVVLLYLERMADIEEKCLYYRCDSSEMISLIRDGLAHNNGINVGSDNHLAFSSIDSTNRLQGFAGCPLETFIELLSYGLENYDYCIPFQYKK